MGHGSANQIALIQCNVATILLNLFMALPPEVLIKIKEVVQCFEYALLLLRSP